MLTTENTVRLETTISPALNAALDQMVELTGVSKATFIRVTLTERLSALGTLVPDAPASITPTRALGRLASAKRKATR